MEDSIIDNNEYEEITINIKKNNKSDIWGFHLKSSPTISKSNTENDLLFTVNKVKPEGKAYGLLLPGDELISVNNIRITSGATLTQALHIISSSSQLSIVIRREKDTSVKSTASTNENVVQSTSSNAACEIKFLNCTDESSDTKKISTSGQNENEATISDTTHQTTISPTHEAFGTDSNGSIRKREYLNPEFRTRKHSLNHIKELVKLPLSEPSQFKENINLTKNPSKSEPSKLKKMKKKFDARTLKFTLKRKKNKQQENWLSSENLNFTSESCINFGEKLDDIDRERLNNIISNENGYLGIISKLKHRKHDHFSSQSKSTSEAHLMSVESKIDSPINRDLFKDDFTKNKEKLCLEFNESHIDLLSQLKLENIIKVQESIKDLGIYKGDIIIKINNMPVTMVMLKSYDDWITSLDDHRQITIEIWRIKANNINECSLITETEPKNTKNVEITLPQSPPVTATIDKSPPVTTTIDKSPPITTNIDKSPYMSNICMSIGDNKIDKEKHIINNNKYSKMFPRENTKKKNHWKFKSLQILMKNTFHLTNRSHHQGKYSSECVENYKCRLRPNRLIIHQSDSTLLGVRLGGGNIHGIFVSSIQKNGRADISGLKVGYKILKVNSISFENITLEEATLTLINLSVGSTIEIEYVDMIEEYRCASMLNGDDLYIRSHIDINPKNGPLDKPFICISKNDLIHLTSTMYNGRLGVYQCEKINPYNLTVEEIGCIPSKQQIVAIGHNKQCTIKQLDNIIVKADSENYLNDPYERLDWIEAPFSRPVILYTNIDGNLLENIMFTEYNNKFQPFPLLSSSQSHIINYICQKNIRLLAIANNDNIHFIKPYISIAIHLRVNFSKDCYNYFYQKYYSDLKFTPSKSTIDIVLDNDHCKGNSKLSLNEFILHKKTICINKNDIDDEKWINIILKSIESQQKYPILLPITIINQYVKHSKLLCSNDDNNKTCLFLNSDDRMMELNRRSIIESTEKQLLMIPHGEILQYDLGIKIKLEGAGTHIESNNFFVQSFKLSEGKLLGLLIGSCLVISNRTLIVSITKPIVLNSYSKIVIFTSKTLQDIPWFWNECICIPLKKKCTQPYNILLKFDNSQKCTFQSDE